MDLGELKMVPKEVVVGQQIAEEVPKEAEVEKAGEVKLKKNQSPISAEELDKQLDAYMMQVDS